MELLSPLPPEFFLRIGTSILCGSIVGLERQIRGKPAGIRTSILICLGTHLFVQMPAFFPNAQMDPTRVIAQVMPGIGFIGAGVIMAREGLVTGVTTASVIWVMAAIGVFIGLGQYSAALAVSLVTVGILLGVEFLEVRFKVMSRGYYRHRIEKRQKKT